MANQLGKRYTCETCGSSVLCTKSGEGEIDCCEKTMEIQEPRKLPSSDQVPNSWHFMALPSGLE